MKLSKIIQALEDWAPPQMAVPGDNVGLIVGSQNKEVYKILVVLDLCLKTIKQAIRTKTDLIIAHHTFIREGINKFDLNSWPGQILELLIKHHIAVYVAHTNLDVASGGVNDILAKKLDMVETEVLQPTYIEQLYKLVVFVPSAYLDNVRSAVCAAGAGHIGRYSDCSFSTAGLGTFRPLEGTKPYLGSGGKLECVNEERLETIVPEHKINNVLASLKIVHPYEEIAYDLYPLRNQGIVYGFGRVGKAGARAGVLSSEFIQKVKRDLKPKNLIITGRLKPRIKRAAVGSGSGGNLIGAAVSAGAEVLVIGEAGYHDSLKAAELGLCVIEAGHYETEVIIVPVVKEYLKNKLGKNITVL
jgi:dinuclear metal center YbgI/SA1388 family protein